MKGLARATIALCALLAAVSAPRALHGQAPQPFAGNLLIVTVDGLRADRLGIAGYRADRSITPRLDALAKRGAYFKRVWAQAPSSGRALGALLTSRYPRDIAWGRAAAARPRLLAANLTLFELLRAAGYRTIGVVSNFGRELGMRQGFDEWSGDSAGERAAAGAASTPARVIARLKQAAAQERFALWTHLSPPLPSCEGPIMQPGASTAAAAHDAAVEATDRSIGELLDGLDALGMARTTTVVVAGVHGSACGEHGRAQGQDLFEEQLRVPLIVAVPGMAPMTVDVPAAGIDLAPTLLELTGQAIPAQFQGKSLLAHVRNRGGPEDKVRPVYAELMPDGGVPERATMLVVDGFKLIHRPQRARYELYSLREDRAETRDLVADPNHEVAFETLRRRLAAFERHRGAAKRRRDASKSHRAAAKRRRDASKSRAQATPR